MSVTDLSVPTPAAHAVEPVAVKRTLSARVKPVTDWFRKTWQPTQEQLEAARRALQGRIQASVTRAGDRVRATLGGPTTEVLADMNRRLSRIESRLDGLGGKEAKEREKRGA
jgi:hypothetical protein